jgi:hydroxypyruvate isomerase
MWLQAARTLTRLAELGERAGRVFTLENLNTAVDHPGTPFAKAADTLALVEAVASPQLRLNPDLYHAQIGEGNLIQLLERALPLVGEIQVADVPGRREPGTGEINYPAVAAASRHRRPSRHEEQPMGRLPVAPDALEVVVEGPVGQP